MRVPEKEVLAPELFEEKVPTPTAFGDCQYTLAHERLRNFITRDPVELCSMHAFPTWITEPDFCLSDILREYCSPECLWQIMFWVIQSLHLIREEMPGMGDLTDAD